VPKVLYADDDRLIRRFLHDALTIGGYDVVSAPTARRRFDGSVTPDRSTW
jgi:DNA-binding response OmpR family regulator